MKDRGLRYILGNTDGLCIGIFAALKQSALCGHTIRRQMYVGGDMRPWVAQVNVSCGGKSADYVAMKLCSEPCMLSGLDECCFVAPQYAVREGRPRVSNDDHASSLASGRHVVHILCLHGFQELLRLERFQRIFSLAPNRRFEGFTVDSGMIEQYFHAVGR